LPESADDEERARPGGVMQSNQEPLLLLRAYHSWRGSVSQQDSHMPLIAAQQNYPSAKLKKIVDKAAGRNRRC
jgi:hypothetical protein